MSTDEKDRKGKRPQELDTYSFGIQGQPQFTHSNAIPQQSSSYPYERPSFSDVYKPAIHRSGSGGPNLQYPAVPSGPSIQPPPGKVAIPALRSMKSTESRSAKKGRTTHACNTCRKAKAGCSGGQPCSRCRALRTQCIYGDGKRDREKKELAKLSQETQNLVQYNTEVIESLRRIRDEPGLSLESIRSALDELIAGHSADSSPNLEQGSLSTTSRNSRTKPVHAERSDSGEQEVGADAGSIGSSDEVDVNTDLPSFRGGGHMGKASSVHWQHRTEEIAGGEEGDNKGGTVTIASYHTEDVDIDYFHTSSINPLAWPNAQLAGDLVQAYFDHVHHSFPILDKADFLFRFNSSQKTPGSLSNDDVVWLATLNAVFAISAGQAGLMANSLLGQPLDHMTYAARAVMLCSQQDVFLQESRVASTSALGLLALYYLAMNRVNRAWNICGLALRHAFTLGLHVKNTAKNITDTDKEYRVRVFWSLYSLECTLNHLTGRPSCVGDRDISSSMPVNAEEADFRSEVFQYDMMQGVQPHAGSESSSSEHQARKLSFSRRISLTPITFKKRLDLGQIGPLPLTSSTFFIYRIQISIIMHEIIQEFYCSETPKESWLDVENTIRNLDQRLINWSKSLPKEFDVNFNASGKPDFNDINALNRFGLAMLYSSARLILFRPCLCQLDKPNRIPHQSETSKRFDQETVRKCVYEARRTIAILAWLASTPSRLYAIPPFWNTLHCLCEALSVLMLELALKVEHLPDEVSEIVEDAKRGIRWLIMMAEHSISARKAWEIFDRLIRVVTPKIKQSVYDLPTQAPVPPGYNYLRFFPVDQTVDYRASPQGMAPAEQTFHRPSETPQYYPPESDLLPTAPQTHFSNPLDDTAAYERFFAIGQIQRQFDWQDYYPFSALTTSDTSQMNLSGSMGLTDIPGVYPGSTAGASDGSSGQGSSTQAGAFRGPRPF